MLVKYLSLLVVLGGCALVRNASATATPYTLFLSETTVQGNFGGTAQAQTLCDIARAARGLSGPVTPIFWITASGVVPFNITANVYGPTGIFIATGANFRSGELDVDLFTAQVGTTTGGCATFWTGLGTAFNSLTSNICTNWASTSGNGRIGSCATTDILWATVGTNPCSTSNYILCAFQGLTPAPTTRSPSVSPSTPQPSAAPTSSTPSVSPTSSRPSVSPTSSTPTKNPVRATSAPTPFTVSPTGGDNTPGTGGSAQDLAIPVGAGVGGGIALLFLLAVVLVLSRRRKARRTSNLSNIGK